VVRKADARTKKELQRQEAGMDYLSPEAARRMLNEMQAHKIQLEIQHEELKRTQAELEASYALYSDFYNIAPVGHLTINPKGLIVQANLTMAAMLEVTRESLVRQKLIRFILPEDQDDFVRHLKQLFSSGVARACELRLVKKSGEHFWVLIEATRVQDAEHVSLCRAVLSNINDRKQAEDELRVSEEKIRYMTENSSDTLWHLDPNYRFDYISPADERMRGFKQTEVIGTSVWELMKPEGIEHVKRGHAKRLVDEQNGIRTGTIRFELEQLCKDGSWIWTEVNSTAHHDKDGKLIGLHGVTRDISERKKAEEALKASETRYHAIMDQSFEALAVIDIQSQELVEVNRRFTEVLGYSLPEDAPLHVASIVADGQQNLAKCFRSVRQQRSISIGTGIFQHKNGTEIFAERAGKVISIGGRNFLLASGRDLTAERRRQSELTRDIELARRVQRGLLPELATSPFVSLQTIYCPSNFVSGDSYHLEWRNEGNLLRGFIIDVSGHGLGTAIQTSSINVLLQDPLSAELSLPEKLRWVNSRAARYFADGSYAAILGFELDLLQRELRYVGAGITQFYANGRKIETPGMFVGLWEEVEFAAGVIAVHPGDTFHFLTDGFTDWLVQSENEGFWSTDGKDFEADVAALEKLAEHGRLRDDATGVCLKVVG